VGLAFRCGTANDLDACAAICQAAFAAIADRHAFPPDFPSVEPAAQLITSLLARDDIYSVVAEIDGRVVGSNFLWETAPVVGVGPITVDPAVQDRAVGRRLMEDVLQRARDQGFAGVRLVQAGYHNRSLALYAKLGFEVREPLATMQGPALGVTIPGQPSVRPPRPTPRPATSCTCGCTASHAAAISTSRSSRAPPLSSSAMPASRATRPGSASSAMPWARAPRTSRP
jgi:predicted N-acetyltransferase YhbS